MVKTLISIQSITIKTKFTLTKELKNIFKYYTAGPIGTYIGPIEFNLQLKHDVYSGMICNICVQIVCILYIKTTICISIYCRREE